ncbi:MAG: thymidine phosphorylase [Propionibacteriaceae bacterium]|jgi:thymidine phosphorylase|nr:thymidine phosphorylase [Propionibacteriaceae bacterium]
MAEPCDAVDVIMTKRDGKTLSIPQIKWMIDAYTRGVVAEEQMSALLMAIFLQGFTREELNCWTDAMIASGERLDFTELARPTVDKHSTGGVGDKITLPLSAVVASFGVAVPQLSGRGLGHTGGTLDKLESIPGWRAALSLDEMKKQLSEIGAVVCQAGSGLAPADRKLYALRDVTGTVASIPLIASSIMSKKIAEGTSALMLDVKCGSGAFMTEIGPAQELASTMVEIGEDHGVHTVALITDMSTPLGKTVGNALEVRESVEVLAGGGPDDVIELTLRLAREMLDAASTIVEKKGIPGAGVSPGSKEALRRAEALREADLAESLKNGRAMDSWRAIITAQGGDPDAELGTAQDHEEILCPTDGFMTRLDALKVGVAGWRLGAGRARKEDAVQIGAGIQLHAKPGDSVRRGQSLMTLHSDTPEAFQRAKEVLEGAWTIDDNPPEPSSVVIDRVASAP